METTKGPTSNHWKSPAVIRHTFGAVARPDARILILGSMPGVASLRAGEYYAHPQNQFWSIMGAVFGAGRQVPYRRRLRLLEAHGVALWDVVSECVRPGSMDGDIVAASVRPNDFSALFRTCPQIRAILFNGQAAARLFRRYVAVPADFRLVTLPSTSPAFAAMPLARKVAVWRAACELPG